MELNENIFEIITRHLNQEASDDEKAELESWLKEDPANQQEFDAYRKIWEDSSVIVEDHDFNTSVAWKKLEKRIRPPGIIKPIKRGRVFSMKRMAVAAAMVLFVAIGIVYLLNSNKVGHWKTIAALKSNQEVTLPDGSTVILRKGSTLRYQPDFADNRLSELNGEGFFEVKHDHDRPFLVNTNNALIKVLGTSFLIKNSDSLDEVVVKTGKVQFTNRNDPSQKMILIKDQKAELINGSFTRDTVLNANYMSWQNRKLIFHNTPLKEVAEDISDFYKIKVTFTPEIAREAKNINIKAAFDNEPLEQVIDEIELMTGLKLSIRNGSVVIGK